MTLVNKTIGLVGAGAIGTLVARECLAAGVTEILLHDVREDHLKGKILDLQQMAALDNVRAGLHPCSTLEQMKHADALIITASVPYTNLQARDQLIAHNAALVTDIARQLRAIKYSGVCLMVSNPVDVMTTLLHQYSGLDRTRILGVSGTLQAGRFKALLGDEVEDDLSSLFVPVIGAHWPDPVFVFSQATLHGRPLTERLPMTRLTTLAQKAGSVGAEIIRLLKPESTAFAPAGAVMAVLRALFAATPSIICGSTLLQGNDGIDTHHATGLPVHVGRGTLQGVAHLPLTTREKEAFLASSAQTAHLLNALPYKEPLAAIG